MTDPATTGDLEINQLQALIIQVRSQLEEERANGTPTRESLEQFLQEVESKIKSYEDDTRRAKDLAKRRKREIDDWKEWYNRLTLEEQTEHLAQLKSEIDWRSKELETLTQQIQEALVQIEWQESHRQLAQQRIIAYDHGVYERPISEDPRLTSLQERLDILRANLN